MYVRATAIERSDTAGDVRQTASVSIEVFPAAWCTLLSMLSLQLSINLYQSAPWPASLSSPTVTRSSSSVGCDDGAVIKCVVQPLSWTPCGWLVIKSTCRRMITSRFRSNYSSRSLSYKNQFSKDMNCVKIKAHSDILSLVVNVVKSFVSSCSLYYDCRN